MNSARIIKSIAIACCSLLAVAIIVAINNPARGYEMSIYKATPAMVWVVITLSILAGVGIIAHQVYHRREDKSKMWAIGFLLVSFGFIVLLSVHVFRGYLYYGRADSTSHLAIVRDLVLQGRTYQQNIYPITHIYVAQLHLVWNISLTRLISYLPIVFNSVYILSFLLLSRTILPAKRQVILASTAGIFLLVAVFGSVYSDPNQLANLLMPLAFSLCIRRLAKYDPVELQITVLFLIMVFLIPPFHVVSAFALWLALVSLPLPKRLYVAIFRNKQTSRGYPFLMSTIVLFVWAISWISSFYAWEVTVKNIYTSLTVGGPSWASQLEDQMLAASLYGYSWMEQFLKVYSTAAVYGLMAIVSFPLVLRRLNRGVRLDGILALYGPLVVYAGALLVLYSLRLGFTPTRLVVYGMILCTVFVGFFVDEIMERARKTSRPARMVLWSVAVIMAALLVNSVLKAYPSPYTLWGNDQPTLSEPGGFSWFVTHREGTMGVVTLTLPIDRLVRLLPQPTDVGKDISRVPYHFNYDQGSTALGSFYSEDRYMLLNQLDRLQYVELLPQMAQFRFYPGDFARLEDDATLDKVYLNGGLDVWYIHGTRAGL